MTFVPETPAPRKPCRKCGDTGWLYAPFYKDHRPCLIPECVAYRATCATIAQAEEAARQDRRQARQARIAARQAQEATR